jgi:8-oxo-dGTP pyrophosphatase MutT (NUDIX family)
MPKKTNFIRDTEGWRTLGEEVHYESPHLTLSTQTVLTPTRGDKPAKWSVVHRKSAVVVAPLTAAGNFVLVKQERIPVRATLWEFPAGQIDEDDDTNLVVIRDTAARELREETGYELPADGSGQLIALGYFFTSQGFTDEHNHLFLARGVVLSDEGSAHDENEGIVDCQEFPPDELRRMIAENEITNANTLSLYAKLCARGLEDGGSGPKLVPS